MQRASLLLANPRTESRVLVAKSLGTEDGRLFGLSPSVGQTEPISRPTELSFFVEPFFFKTKKDEEAKKVSRPFFGCWKLRD